MESKIANCKKMIIFDWGGVIESHRDVEYNIDCAVINLFKRFNNELKDEQILSIYNECSVDNNGIYISEKDNLIEVEKWFERMKQKGNLKCEFNEFCSAYEEEFGKVYYYSEVVNFAHSLKSYCKIGILSNLNYIDKNRIDMQVDLKKFDSVFLSFELRCRKPNSKIYEEVEKVCNIDPKNILFIDDKKQNIEAAQKRGWNTCQAYGYELDRIKKEVDKFLSN